MRVEVLNLVQHVQRVEEFLPETLVIMDVEATLIGMSAAVGGIGRLPIGP